MISSQTIRMVPEELLFKRRIICRFNNEPGNYEDPIYRGTLLWLREQAKQAEIDSEREWLGFKLEFDLLQSGNHPDPHPERIILGKDDDNFDPSILEEPESTMRRADNAAFNQVSNSLHAEKGYPVKSQQLLAHLCRREMDIFLGIREDS